MNKWVVFPKTGSPIRRRLFCFPYAGGAASIFFPWSKELPSDIQVCPVQLPGRENRLTEPPLTKISLLVDSLAEILPLYSDVPFSFFGHSMGALISFELTRRLRRNNSPCPTHLFVASHPAPQLRVSRPQLHTLSDAAFIQALRRLNGTPEELLQNSELMQLVLPALRADFALCETYVYTGDEPLDCPISTFAGMQERNLSRYELEAWRSQTRRSFRLQIFPGNHFFLKSARKLLLTAIERDLEHA